MKVRLLITGGTIDKVYNENIIPLDIKKYDDLEKKILSLKNNNKLYKKVVLNNFQSYKKKFFKLENYYRNLFFN